MMDPSLPAESTFRPTATLQDSNVIVDKLIHSHSRTWNKEVIENMFGLTNA